MFRRLGVVVAIIAFTMSVSSASAITVPIDEHAGTPAVTTLQQAVDDIANGAAQIVTSIEAAVGRIVGEITDRLAGVDRSGRTLSYTASAATPIAATTVVANTAVEPVASASPGSAPLSPPSATTQVIVEKEQPIVEAAPSVSTAQFSALLGSLYDLLVLLPGAASSTSGGGSADYTTTQQQLDALQREVAQTNQINSLSNVTLNSPTIVSPSIAGLSTSQVPEGLNLYFTNARVAGYIDSSSTIPSVAGGAFGNVLSWNGFGWVATATSSLGVLGSQWTALGNTLSYTSGNVGIGTTSPSALLTMDSSNATGTILRISNSSTGGHVFDLVSTGSGNTNGAGRLDIFDSTAGQARLSIATNGYVGIGTTSPFAAFAVAGNAILSGNLSVGDPVTTRSNLGLAYASAGSIGSLSVPIAAWGDSLTQGTFTNVNTPYPTQLSQLSGYVVFNGGVGGQVTAQIASRMLLAGDKYSWPTIIWTGRNDISGTLSTDEPNILSGIASMVAALQSAGNNNYIILSIINTTLEPSGNANYNEIVQINSDLASTYGSHYLDLREYMVQNGLSVAGITPSAQDLADISNDIIPTDLHYDFMHFNTAGYGVVAHFILSNISLLNGSYATQGSTVVTQNNLRQALADFSSGLSISGNRVLYANSTNLETLVGFGAGFNLATSTLFNTAVGYQSLYNSTSSGYNTAVGTYTLYNNMSGGTQNVAVGYTALYHSTTGNTNVAIGNAALWGNTTGGSNTAIGYNSLGSNTTGGSNVALGYSSMNSNITGRNNVAIGQSALYNNKSASSTIAIGYGAAQGSSPYNNQNGVYVGFEAGFSAATSSDYNTLVGFQAGFDISTGTKNILIGPEVSSGGNHLTSGTNNIGIGYNLVFPGGATANNQLNIGNFIFGTGLTTAQSGTSIPATLTGSIALGTSTPAARLTVWGPDSASSTPLFTAVNNSSSTVFAVFDGGNAQLSGTLTQSSDQRLKTNIQALDASSSLSLLDDLNPVTFDWINPDQGTTPQFGFIAQQVQQIFPDLVSTTSPTALTPNGTLGLNYIGLISPIVAAIQQLDREITSLASAVAGFAESFTTKQLTFVRGQGNEIDVQTANVQKLCIGSTCVTEAQLQALLASANQSSAAPSPSSEATDTPPVIAINGENPAIIQVGASYSDLGATITGPQADLNLGIKTFVNGLFVSNIVLDTSAAATDTIDYVVTDQNGLTSTSTRTVIVEPAIAPSNESTAAAAASTTGS